jgi:hypothetical protein
MACICSNLCPREESYLKKRLPKQNDGGTALVDPKGGREAAFGAQFLSLAAADSAFWSANQTFQKEKTAVSGVGSLQRDCRV